MERGSLGCNDAAQLVCNKAWCTCHWRSNERCRSRRMQRSGEPTPWERVSKKIVERGGLGCDDASQLVGNKAWCTCYGRSNERCRYQSMQRGSNALGERIKVNNGVWRRGVR
ncbi:hypothetical protein MKW98_026913 [Papaver atlanticum]|uniref:Uncharacterized protein n=1 Tax=Papaver atlanticum TaxID=357466 RepID=A0AAD4XL36_9MAGN|nr:hypothetical protein MKW98_026913 [Papaver atlanticum]